MTYDTIFNAVINCWHSIDADRVVLNYDSEKPGKNALDQLHRRISATLDALAAPAAAQEAVTEVLTDEQIVDWFCEEAEFTCGQWQVVIDSENPSFIDAVKEHASRAHGIAAPTQAPQAEPARSHSASEGEAAAQIDAYRHVANEWADCACNGLQAIRNIADGIETDFENVRKNITSNLEHCQKVSEERYRRYPKYPAALATSRPPVAPEDTVRLDWLLSNPNKVIEAGENKVDAERYRWLRSRQPGSTYRIAGVIYSEGGVSVDAAIDAAMQQDAARTTTGGSRG